MGVSVEVTGLRQVERRLGAMKQKAPKALKLAINDTARKARSRLAKEAKKTYAVKAAGFHKAMEIKFATNSRQEATIRSRGKKVPLGKYSMRDGTLGPEVYYNPTLHREQVGKGGMGASGKILKSSGFKGSQTAELKWFVAKMKSGHKGIFQRTSTGSRKIKEKMGLSIPQMLGSEKHVYGIVEPHIKSDLKEALDRHVLRALRGEI